MELDLMTVEIFGAMTSEWKLLEKNIVKIENKISGKSGLEIKSNQGERVVTFCKKKHFFY